MAPMMPSRKKSERALWICAAVLLAAGYYLITIRYEQKISKTTEMTQFYRSKAVENRRLVAQEARMVVLRRQIRGSLSKVVYGRTPSQDMVALLSDIDRLARAHQSQVLSITPQMKKNATHPKLAALILENDRLDIGLRGRFRDLLAFVSTLPRRHVLLRVAQMEFALSGTQNRRASAPVLDVKIRVLLYHVGRSDLLGEL